MLSNIINSVNVRATKNRESLILRPAIIYEVTAGFSAQYEYLLTFPKQRATISAMYVLRGFTYVVSQLWAAQLVFYV